MGLKFLGSCRNGYPDVLCAIPKHVAKTGSDDKLSADVKISSPCKTMATSAD